MNVIVNMYAALKDYFPDSIELSVEAGSKISDIQTALIARNPESRSLLDQCRFAANHEFMSRDAIITDGNVVDILPPSSGG
ncbi:MAG: MoaD/ThiS family protein [Spirochaetia bacterium]|nr:MoaD/ThiS family protein [Spirochaetia bacterium]